MSLRRRRGKAPAGALDEGRGAGADLFGSFAIGFLVFLGYALIWSWRIRPFYYPRGDSFAVLVNSLPIFHPKILLWFSHGFQRYFHVYPDLAREATNFIRPGVNATFYLEWFLFHAHWERYLLTTYALLAVTAGLVFYTATRLLGLPRRLAVLASLAAAVSPAWAAG